MGMVSRGLADNITYNLVDYPLLQDGWSLSGQITTDGVLGTLLAADIVSWNWTISQGSQAITVTSSMPGAIVSTSLAPQAFFATSTTLSSPPSLADVGLEAPNVVSISQITALVWSNATYHTVYSAVTADTSGATGSFYWNSVYGGINSIPDFPSSGGLIATIAPEPASMILLALASTSLLFYSRRYRE